MTGDRKPELVICRGLPASGKSTWAHLWVNEDRPHRVRINKDDLRQMIDNGIYISGSQGTEARILAARDALVQKLMERGLSVVVDDTNFARHHVKKLARMAHAACWPWRVEDFDTPVEVCYERDLVRQKSVGHQVISDMWARYIRANGGKFPPVPTEEELFAAEEDVERYIRPPGKRNALIVDIDGTVALRGTRDPFDETRVSEDQPNTYVIDVVLADATQHNTALVFMSGRTRGCEDETLAWLHENGLCPDELIMRPVGDNRPDTIVKLELFNKYVRYNYNVLRVYDDRSSVVKMWRSLGLTVLQVADGNF